MTRFALATLLIMTLGLQVASARSLSEKEQAYTSSLRRMLEIRGPAKREALGGPQSPAQGVRVRFKGLIVVRLHFSSPAAAKDYAQRKEAAPSKAPRAIEVRAAEVVLAGGSELEGRSAEVMSAIWGASLDPPSEAPRAQEAAPEPAAKVLVTKSGRKLTLRPYEPKETAAVAPGPLAGTYLVVGAGRVVIDRVQPGPDGTTCRVRFEGFGAKTPAHPFAAVFDGAALNVRVEGREVAFAWKPGPKGVPTFALLGKGHELLPAGAHRFWHPSAE